ncbi:winged helix-turn-helix domain-containing protein [Arenivirga flava]|uniref:Transcriptional regulator n=1 Tax=Arenivirga flava TaxID=1930060 RepID=A0AA37UVU8_9MICO|nr:helix-turn-helix domain-containing protein [Arenivirga flava]GMA29647.1 transcriptional regulator [Arenivirga flava]
MDHERMDALERRIAALEQRGEAGPDAAVEAGTFWALQGLKARTPEPGAVLFTGAVSTPAGAAEWQQGHAVDDLLDEEWAERSAALAALAHPLRLRLLQAIVGGTATAAELGALEGVGTSGQVYHHLGQLVAGGWLAAQGAAATPFPPAGWCPCS